MPNCGKTTTAISHKFAVSCGVFPRITTSQLRGRSIQLNTTLRVVEGAQVLARLKTLSMIQNCSRNLRIEDFGWLDKGPKLVLANRKRKAG